MQQRGVLPDAKDKAKTEKTACFNAQAQDKVETQVNALKKEKHPVSNACLIFSSLAVLGSRHGASRVCETFRLTLSF